jgi:hypothetical protein
MLNSDIGIDLCGHMHVLFEKGIELPSETSIIVDPLSNEVELSFYQGSKAYVKDNLCIGSRILTHDNMGKFEIKLYLDNTLKVFIEELIDEYSFNNILINEETEEDKLIKDTESAKQNYKEYIRETLLTVNRIKDKVNESIIQKIQLAAGILNVDDVTKLEYEMCQKEIENIINPILYNL